MESDGGGIVVAVAVPTTPRRLSSQRSTVHNSVVVNELADYLNSVAVVNKNNNNPTSLRPVSSITLGDVLNGVKKPTSPNKNVVVRNLLEVLRNDETLNASGGTGSPNSKNSWKSFKEKLKRKTSRKWTSSMPVPQSDVLPSRSGRDLMSSSRNSLRNSLRNPSMRRTDSVAADEASMMEVDGSGSPRSGGSFRLSAALAAEREETRRRLSRELDEDGKIDNKKDDDNDEDDEDASQGSGKEDGEEDDDDEEEPNFGAPANQPVKMSLMDLLEETDRQAGIDGPTYRLDDDEEEDYEDDDEDEEAIDDDEQLGKGETCCSVCMVKHKGSAYTPCGHTFCKLCSKELFVQKGNCPLCNNFILEILEIF